MPLHQSTLGRWPLPPIRDFAISKAGVGVLSLWLVVDEDCEGTRELAKLYLLEDSRKAARRGFVRLLDPLYRAWSVMN
ncbi:hypothetical protein [Sphingopyxis soli]|uniref:hypothetical protein n=1 Tax=Sphingopyxis soli TaxID=592051 RepID=UPI001BFCD6E9|nr:hypothetical protein [Sphingopyxis soli]